MFGVFLFHHKIQRRRVLRVAYKLPQDQSDAFFDRIENVIDVKNTMISDEFGVFKSNLL